MARPVTSFWRRLPRHDASWPPDSLMSTTWASVGERGRAWRCAAAVSGLFLADSTLDTRRSTLDARRSSPVPRHRSPSGKLRTCNHAHAAPLGRPGPRPTVPGPLGGPLGIRLLHVFCTSSARFCTPSERLLEGRPHGCCRRALVPGLIPHGPRA
jgi:hypothetical protein